jgi:predicted DNA-binding transcriptional regulator
MNGGSKISDKNIILHFALVTPSIEINIVTIYIYLIAKDNNMFF